MPRVADRVLTPPSGELLPKFVASLDPEWIDEALQATGTATIRRRRFPAEQVIWLVIGMCLFRDLSMRELVATMDLALPRQPRDPRRAELDRSGPRSAG